MQNEKDEDESSYFYTALSLAKVSLGRCTRKSPSRDLQFVPYVLQGSLEITQPRYMVFL